MGNTQSNDNNGRLAIDKVRSWSLQRQLDSLGLCIGPEEQKRVSSLPQNSDEWHLFRLLRITASDAPALLSCIRDFSVQETPAQVVERKVTDVKALLAGESMSSILAKRPQTAAMVHGREVEPIAVQAFVANMTQTQRSIQVHSVGIDPGETARQSAHPSPHPASMRTTSSICDSHVLLSQRRCTLLHS